tara:strand:- start:367 stop:978 length:612 start_codon:yes stop_codon:yes gene_type:complete
MAYKQSGWTAFTKKDDYIPQSQRGDWEDYKGKKEKIQWEDYRPQSKKPRPDGLVEAKPMRRTLSPRPEKYLDTGTTIGEGLPSDTMKNVQQWYGKEHLKKAKNFEYTPQTIKSKWGTGKGEELKPATTVDRDQHSSWFGQGYSQPTPQTQDYTRRWRQYNPQSVVKNKKADWFQPLKMEPIIPTIKPIQKKKKKYVPQTQRKK